MELIKIKKTEGGKQVCSARDLHEFLEVKTEFKDWMPRMLEYGFEKGVDFSFFLRESTGGRPGTDYLLTLDCAKEIAMIQRTEKGKQARQYFIACEKAALTLTPATMNRRELLQLALDQEIENERLQSEIKSLEPKRIFAEAVCASHTSILIGELAKIIKQNGVDMGQNRLFEVLRAEGYLIRRQGTDFNMPTQRSMDLEIFEIKETVISHADGHTSISKTTKVTGKGQVYFINKFINKTENDTQN